MRQRPGFTLVELLIVVVIIAILASIAVLKVHAVRQRAMQSVLEADLRQLSIQQENYFASHNNYANDPLLAEAVPSDYTSVNITFADPTGWGAYATHSAWPGHRCALYYGAAPPITPATLPGVITCNP